MRNKKLVVMFSVLAALVLLVVLSSVLFSVQHIDVYCYNADDTALEREVAERTGLKKGGSIFVVNEDKIAQNVERGTDYRVRVINVERKFPNRVSVNYAKVFPVAYLHDGDVSYVCGHNGVISVVEPQPPENYIRVFSRSAHGTQTGDKLLTGTDGEIFGEIIDTFVRLQYVNSNEIIDLVQTVDLRFESGIFIRMRAGCAIQLIGKTNIFDNLRLAMSAFAKEDAWKLGGTIVVSAGASSYSSKDLYQEALEKL